jgi:hypothetical protein
MTSTKFTETVSGTMQRFIAMLTVVGLSLGLSGRVRAEAPLQVNPGDKIVVIGNTFAERMSFFGHYETRLHARYPEHKLVFRDLGWSITSHRSSSLRSASTNRSVARRACLSLSRS